MCFRSNRLHSIFPTVIFSFIYYQPSSANCDTDKPLRKAQPPFSQQMPAITWLLLTGTVFAKPISEVLRITAARCLTPFRSERPT
jgi:hypothetical protein